MEDLDEENLTDIPARLRILTVFELWWEELGRILYSDTSRAIICMHVLSRLMDDCFTAEEEVKEASNSKEGFPLLTKLVGMILQDFVEVAEGAFHLNESLSNPSYSKAILRLMVALKQACWMIGDDYHLVFSHSSLEQFFEEHSKTEFTDKVFHARFAFLAGEFIEDMNSDLPFNPANLIQTAITQFQLARQCLSSRSGDVQLWISHQRNKATYVLNADIPIPVPNMPPDSTLQVSDWCQDEEQIDDSTDQLLMLTAGNLRFLSATADYTEALPLSLEADMITSCLDLLDCPYFPLQLFALGWIVNALSHKKLAADLVDREGIIKIMSFTKAMETKKNYYMFLAPYTSYILVALSKHSQPMEALIRDYNFGKDLLSFVSQLFLLENNMDVKLNIVEWFGEIFGHPLMLHLSQEMGIIPLIAWQMKQVLSMDADEKMGPIKPAFIKEAARSLLKYININLYWAVQYSKGSVSELASHSIASNGHAYLSCNIVRIDEQQMHSLELYVLRYLALYNQFPPGMKIDILGRFKDEFCTKDEFVEESYHTKLSQHFTRKNFEDDTVSVLSEMRNVLPDWNVAKGFLDYDLIPMLLMLLKIEGKDSHLHTLSLQSLQLLCLEPACIIEIQHCLPHNLLPNREDIDEIDNALMKKGLEILLHMVSPNIRRDPAILISTLKVLCAMCTPPQYRYNGNSSTEAEKLLIEYQKKQTEQTGTQVSALSSARKRLSFDTAKKVTFVRETIQSKLETVQAAARIGVRAYAGISSLAQLLYFRRNQAYVFCIRLEAIKILIGIAHDKEICQILSKMRVDTMISNQVQNTSGQQGGFESASLMSNSDKALLLFYSNILSEAIYSSVPISERHIDATQEALTRKSVVDKSHIDFDDEELLDLIQEHLVAKGLHDTAAAMRAELSQTKNGISKNESCHPTHSNAFAMKSPAPVTTSTNDVNTSTSAALSCIKKRQRSTSPEPNLDEPSTNRKLTRKLSHDLQTPGPTDVNVPIPCSRANSLTAQEPTTQSSTAFYANAVPSAWSQKKKNIMRAMKGSSYAEVARESKGHSALPHLMLSPQAKSMENVPVPTTCKHRSEASKPSRLSTIMQRYLKLQHSQCKHPVATLPLMSLFKPHVCPRPKVSTRTNLSQLLQPLFSLRNTSWYNYPRHAENLQMLRYIYSSYKPVRTFRYIDNDCSVSSAAFSHDSTKVWVAHVPAWDGGGPGLAYTNYLSGVQETVLPMDLQEAGGLITNIALSPIQSQAPLIMLSVISDTGMLGAEHRVLLWKDVGSVETFDSRCSHNIQVQTPNTANNESGPISIFWEESFSRSGRHLGVVYSLESTHDSRPDPYAGAVLDLISGVTVYNIIDQDNMQSYDRPQITFADKDDNLLLFDGKLWDLRMSQCAHRFDKLSNAGYTSVHPYKPEIIIDGSVWDLRNFNLAQTVPMLDGCKVYFNDIHNVLFAHKEPNTQELQFDPDNNFFHVLDSNYYQHMHTEIFDRENMELCGLQVDRHGLGYINTMFAGNDGAMCKVFEIGKRRVVGDGDSGDEDDEDDDDMDEEDGDWYDQGFGVNPDEDDDDDEDEDEDEGGSGNNDEEEDDDDFDDEDITLGSDEDDDDEDEGDDDRDGEDDEDFEDHGGNRMNEDEEGWETVSEASG